MSRIDLTENYSSCSRTIDLMLLLFNLNIKTADRASDKVIDALNDWFCGKCHSALEEGSCQDCGETQRRRLFYMAQDESS